MGVPPARWMPYFREKSHWMIWGYPYVRKPLFGGCTLVNIRSSDVSIIPLDAIIWGVS